VNWLSLSSSTHVLLNTLDSMYVHKKFPPCFSSLGYLVTFAQQRVQDSFQNDVYIAP
jgi:hypothetical protein